MKIKNIVIVIVVSVVMSLCVLHGKSTAKSQPEILPVRIAVVSMRKVLAESEKNAEFEKSITAEGEKIKESLMELEEEIIQGREVLRRFKPTSSDYQKRSQDLIEKEISLEAKNKSFQQQFSARQQTWAEETFKAVLKVVDKVAKSKGYDMVLAKEDYQWPAINANELMIVIKTSKVLYSSDEMDITDDVLIAWNKADFGLEF